MNCFKAGSLLVIFAISSSSTTDARADIHRAPRHRRQQQLAAPPPNTITLDGPTGTITVPFTSYTFGARTDSAPVAGGGQSTPRAYINSIQISRLTDEGSPSLFQLCVAGNHLRTVTLMMGVVKLTLGDVIVTECKVSSNESDLTLPSVDAVTLNCKTMAITVGAQTARLAG